MLKKALFVKEWLTYVGMEGFKNNTERVEHQVYSFTDGANTVFFHESKEIKSAFLQEGKKYLVNYKKLEVEVGRYRGLFPISFSEKN